jgi:hypothetical protein
MYLPLRRVRVLTPEDYKKFVKSYGVDAEKSYGDCAPLSQRREEGK